MRQTEAIAPVPWPVEGSGVVLEPQSATPPCRRTGLGQMTQRPKCRLEIRNGLAMDAACHGAEARPVKIRHAEAAEEEIQAAVLLFDGNCPTSKQEFSYIPAPWTA